MFRHDQNRSSSRMRKGLCRRVDITALADAGGKLPADATRVVKPVYASPMRIQVRLLPWIAWIGLCAPSSCPRPALCSLHSAAPSLAS